MKPAPRSLGRRLAIEQLEHRYLMTSAWQNPGQALDVNDGLLVNQADTTLLLNAVSAGQLYWPLPTRAPGSRSRTWMWTAKNLREWTDSLKQQEVQVFLPKFKLTTQIEMKPMLTATGMPTPFTNDADFSKMATDEKLKISDVIHKAFVDVNEKGTEAAAVTAALMRPESAQIRLKEPPVFRADHPFMFVIQDNRSGAILFLGRVSDPSASTAP